MTAGGLVGIRKISQKLSEALDSMNEESERSGSCDELGISRHRTPETCSARPLHSKRHAVLGTPASSIARLGHKDNFSLAMFVKRKMSSFHHKRRLVLFESL